VDVDLVEVGCAAAGPVASVIVIIKAQQPTKAERTVFRLIEGTPSVWTLPVLALR
jgi:hypothetical protein